MSIIQKEQNVTAGQSQTYQTTQVVQYNPEREHLMVMHSGQHMAISTTNWDKLNQLVKEARGNKSKGRFEVYASIHIPSADDSMLKDSIMIITRRNLETNEIEVLKQIVEDAYDTEIERQQQRKLWENYAIQQYDAIITR